MTPSPELNKTLAKASDILDALDGVETDAAFICDSCGKGFLPDENTYIGPKNSDDNSCSMFMEWENLCKECNNGR